jgi:hypothetical protein
MPPRGQNFTMLWWRKCDLDGIIVVVNDHYI